MKKLILSLITLSTLASGNSLLNAQDAHNVRDIVERTEVQHQVKCKIKSATTLVGDQLLNFKCKSSERKLKLMIRTSQQSDQTLIHSYQVIFRK